MPFVFIILCVAAVPVQILIFLALIKFGGRRGLLSYFGLIGMPLAICFGGGLLPFLLGLNGDTPVWDLFQIIVGVVTLLLVLQGFGFGVILRRKGEGILHPWNIAGLMVLVATPLILVLGAIIIAYFDATLPVILFLSIYLLAGVYLLVRRWEENRVLEDKDND